MTNTVDEEYGTVLNFNGNTATIEKTHVPDIIVEAFSPSFYTISFWIIFLSDEFIAKLFRMGTNSIHRNIAISARETRTLFGFYNNSVPVDFVMSPNTWYHVSYVRDVGDFYLYINASLVGQKRGFNVTTGLSDIVVGNFDGYMSDYRIYEGALSITAVQELVALGPNKDFKEPTISSVEVMSKSVITYMENIDNMASGSLFLKIDDIQVQVTENPMIITGLKENSSRVLKLYKI